MCANFIAEMIAKPKIRKSNREIIEKWEKNIGGLIKKKQLKAKNRCIFRQASSKSINMNSIAVIAQFILLNSLN